MSSESLKEPSTLEATLPSDLRPYSRSPGVTLHRPGSSCHSSQTCHFTLLYSSCLAHCSAIGEAGKDWYKARKNDIVAGREQGGGRAPLLTLSRSSLPVEDNREVAIKQGFRDPRQTFLSQAWLHAGENTALNDDPQSS